MSLEYRVGDVWDRLSEIESGTIDLIVTSPPFLALRSYLPADHPLKAKEIGSEATPAAYIDTLLALTAEFGRVLAPHGSLCVELGDTYSGDDRRNGETVDAKTPHRHLVGRAGSTRANCGAGWPLAKSLTGIPTLYPWSLAYGRNLLTGEPSPAGLWRIRNIIVWGRPNPPVGALGDKFRPATSYITVACRGVRRFFDLDAVRTEPLGDRRQETYNGAAPFHDHSNDGIGRQQGPKPTSGGVSNAAGAPPLDWHTDNHPEDGDWLWKLPTQPYKGAHYATFPLELPTRLIMAMCPLRVCTVCGKPSERITEVDDEYRAKLDAHAALHYENRTAKDNNPKRLEFGLKAKGSGDPSNGQNTQRTTTTVGWSDCGHNQWRTGVVLDPFCGSGTTLEAAQNVGRHAIGIDLDPRNADLARSRVGMFLTVEDAHVS